MNENPFVEQAVTITDRTVLKDVIDGRGPCSVLMSVTRSGYNAIEITIGAFHKNRCSGFFNRDSLGELIEILTEIKNAEW